MAVLNKIRERSIFLIIIIALALFAFVLADVIRNGGFTGTKGQNEIASVNGESIERTEFAKKVENYRRQLGPNASTMQAVSRVYDAEVRSLVLQDQFEELGIDVGEAQIKNTMESQLAGNPTFSDEAGNFSESKLQEYVANIKATSPQAYQQWLDYENQIAQTAKENIYFNMIKAGVGATLLEGEQAYLMETNTMDVQYVQIPWSSVEESKAQVSKEEIKEYIKKHPKTYTVEAGRDIQYILFSEAPSIEDDSEVKTAVEKFKTNQVAYNSTSGATDTIPSFAQVVDNAAYVNANSDVQYDGTFKFKNQLPTQFADTLFNLEEGEVFGPYKQGSSYRLSKLIETKQMPDSAKARHILISYSGLQTATDVERTEEDAKTLADSLLTALNRDRSKFVNFAATFSADQSNKDKGGDLGYFTPGTMVPAFNDYVFQNDEGDIGIVQTRFGYHILEIEEQTDKEKAVKIATITREIEPSEKTVNDLFAETTKFEIAAKKGDFNEVAKESNLTARPVKGIKGLDENIPGVGKQRAIVNWAFNEETEVGDIKRFDVTQGYVVVQVTGSNKKGLQSVEDASVTVTPIIQQNKKAEILKSQITGSTIEEIAKNQNQTVKTSTKLNLKSPTLAGAGNEPLVVGAAFALKEGEMSKPIQGKNGMYVVKVTKREDATELNNYRAFALQETNKRTQAVTIKAYNALKESAEIEDNRAAIY